MPESSRFERSAWPSTRQPLEEHEAMLADGHDSPYAEWLEKWDDNVRASFDKSHRVTTRVECGDYFAVRDDALRAHATQVDPDGFWFQVSTPVVEEAYPYEDFELLATRVSVTEPERSLFANIPGHHA